MIIAVDFDGTLSMGPYPEIGNPKPYAVEMMNKLKDDGHYIILYYGPVVGVSGWRML